ncbi:hypothetical protein SAMN05421805_11848 [Saccharopolyspora antimicrobica]|uniref:Uncharacterized protein n=1 Tax=Saccharopolyspora antimicrobica TaxID=455193 RepID=A0A1I5IBT5_9PSEU|nr:hypothetical protein [Saccharopolyspora antimicrobica]RKT85550.1 hypothetical protein ATL45_3897 [Saccharopolyspora antimicrobica]SFO57972.1 hypothetical protein SAMN05421805_11848 [Saccharopolyspora antimicrobica]
MVARPADVAKVAEHGWLQRGESFHRIFERRPGYLASTVAGRTSVPHTPVNPVPKCTQEVSETYLKPSELTARGGHLGDEWVHDWGIRGWASAADGGRLAVQVADVLAAGNGYAWLVATNQRIAVVIPARFVDLPPHQIPPPAPLPGLNTSLITWWQQPPNAVAGIRDVLLGRTIAGDPFVSIDFADGSNLLLRQ